MRERIHFYDEILLFEDELSDNGTSVLSVKIVSTCTCTSVIIKVLDVKFLNLHIDNKYCDLC